jgi:Glyoxalase-like domain
MTAVESPQDEGQRLLTEWTSAGHLKDDVQANPADPPSAPGDYDEYLQQFKREVYANDNALDHILLGASDMEAALDAFEKLTGHRPVYVVSLNGLGTKSARIAFEEGCCFLEIVAPDPKQTPIKTELKRQLQQIDQGRLVPIHYAVRRKNAKKDLNLDWCKKTGCTVDPVTMVAKLNGEPWRWDMCIVDDPNATLGQDGYIPLIVDWNDGPHAAGRLPIVADKATVSVSAPDTNKMHQVLSDDHPAVSNLSVSVGEPSFTLSFTAKQTGQVCKFTSYGTEFRGIRFPAEGGLPVKTGKF